MSQSSADSAAGAGAKKTVVFCVPGRTFTNLFLAGWTQTVHDLVKSNQFNVLFSNQYSSLVHLARAKCLGLSVDRGPEQKPWNGTVPYDVIVWIDSDIVFRARDVLELIQATELYPVVSGIYMMEDREHFCAVENWDTDHYVRNDCTFQFLTARRIAEWTAQTGSVYLPCAYAGLGFCAFRHGVLEDPRLKYPWFWSPVQTIQTGRTDVPEYRDLSSEDVALFRNLTGAGVIPHVMVKTDLRVGHEKTAVL
jgi:hypothetical protein